MELHFNAVPLRPDFFQRPPPLMRAMEVLHPAGTRGPRLLSLISDEASGGAETKKRGWRFTRGIIMFPRMKSLNNSQLSVQFSATDSDLVVASPPLS